MVVVKCEMPYEKFQFKGGEKQVRFDILISVPECWN